MADAPSPILSWTTCPACGAERTVTLRYAEGAGACLSCHRPVEGILFRAARRKSEPPPLAEDEPGEGDTPCFYNPRRKATATCSQCGVFISDSWSAKWGAQTICLRCLEKMRATRRSPQFESDRWLWDNICLLLALAPLCLFFWFIGFVTAPAALILGIWAWKKPRSLVPRSRFRLGLALVLSLIQVAGVLFLLYQFAHALAEGPGRRTQPRQHTGGPAAPPALVLTD